MSREAYASLPSSARIFYEGSPFYPRLALRLRRDYLSYPNKQVCVYLKLGLRHNFEYHEHVLTTYPQILRAAYQRTRVGYELIISTWLPREKSTQKDLTCLHVQLQSAVDLPVVLESTIITKHWSRY